MSTLSNPAEDRMSDTTFIYGLFDPRNCQLRYIGKSNDPEVRLARHILVAKSSYKREKKTSRVYNWISLLLTEGLTPSVEILEEVSVDTWQNSEMAWIAECRSFGLDITNLTDGGDLPPSQKGKRISEEHKEILRQGAKNRPRTEEERRKLSESKKGKSTWVKGKQLTEEHKRRIGKANSGKKPSQEAIAKRLEKMKGYKPSEEHKKKISDALRSAYSEGKRASLKGIPHTEEHKRKISEGGKGRIVSEETKRKIGESNSKALKAYYQRKKRENNNA